MVDGSNRWLWWRVLDGEVNSCRGGFQVVAMVESTMVVALGEGLMQRQW